MNGSVPLSIRLPITPFSQCSYHRIIMKLPGVVTIDNSDTHAKGQGQRSKISVTVMPMQKVKVRGQMSQSHRSKPNFAVSGP